ncbi:hypothetical protein GCM10010440_39410 [Kitasatospora cinereorecta]
MWPTAARNPAYYLRDECEDGGEERQDIAGEHQPGFHLCSLALDWAQTASRLRTICVLSCAVCVIRHSRGV